MLSVIVPCTDARYLRVKLDDFRKLRRIPLDIIVCYNGPEEGLAAALEAVSGAWDSAAVLCRSQPFNKNLALAKGLELARFDRILYTDVDCLLYGDPDLERLDELLRTTDVVSFPVFRSTNALRVVVARAGRRVWAYTWTLFRIPYLSFRGGGYVCGNFRELIRADLYGDDCVYSLEYAMSHGHRIVISEALEFYELPEGARDYPSRLPRLIYGGFQAFRVAKYPRAKLAILLQKQLKYLAVALSPALAVLFCYAVGLPSLLGLAVLVRARTITKTWQGIWIGMWDRPPRW